MGIYRDLIVLSAGYCALLAASLAVSPWICIIMGCCFTAGMMLRRRSRHRRKMDEISKRLTNLRSEGLVIEDKVRGAQDDVFYRMIITLLGDLERSLFKLVEKN
ncbi:MAG: hypothetical protein PHD74_07320, partial [Candidatus Krumholzibacteria bacterium]|nr:hypothetical protein [Candidatus Krumholzibacteria bacterium]